MSSRGVVGGESEKDEENDVLEWWDQRSGDDGRDVAMMIVRLGDVASASCMVRQCTEGSATCCIVLLFPGTLPCR